MEYRQLGKSGLTVPALSFGTGTFGGKGQLFAAWGSTDVAEARRLIDLCLDAGVNMFDTADIYSAGESERILGEAMKGQRDRCIVSTKATFRFNDEPNNVGSSRSHLIASVEQQLKRLQTDHIDLFQLHAYDAKTPQEEVLSTLDTLVRAGKIRYTGVSNFSGWHLMKGLSIADRYGYPRYVANQTYYSLIGREYEWELMPLGIEEGVGLSCGARSGGAGSPAKSVVAPVFRRTAACTVRPSSDRKSMTSTCSVLSMLWKRSRRRPARRSRRSRSIGCCSALLSRPSSWVRVTKNSCGRISGLSAGISPRSRWPSSTRRARCR